jgi:hypothetical protein
MSLENLLNFAIAHELGHALCNEMDEGKANRAAEFLRKGVSPNCEVQFKGKRRR